LLRSVLPRIRKVFEQYASSPLPEWDAFSNTLRVARYAKSRVVEQSSNEFLIILSGLVKEVHDTPSIRGQISEFFSSGSVIATRLEPPWSRSMPTPFSVVSRNDVLPKIPPMTAYAVESVTVLHVNWDVIHRLAAIHPQWGEVQVSLLWTYIEEQYSGILSLREKDLMARYRSVAQRADLAGRLTQRDISAYLGITESALSRLLKRSQDK
jgi:CRP-like cAMP-binding protein